MDNAGVLTISHSTFAANTATSALGGGGAIRNTGTMTLSHTTLAGNSAQGGSGGGIHNYRFSSRATVTVKHSTLSSNSASSYGGGIYNESPDTVTVSHSTLTGNSADHGGGISNPSGGTTTLNNTILAGNTAVFGGPDCFSLLDSAGYNLLGNNSGCTFNESTGDLVGTPDDPIDPVLGPLQDNGGPTFTHVLLTGSPAIDTGTPTECPPEDQRGFPRPIDGDGNGTTICDIGAFELEEGP